MLNVASKTLARFAKQGVQANALSGPPGEYDRKVKTQRN